MTRKELDSLIGATATVRTQTDYLKIISEQMEELVKKLDDAPTKIEFPKMEPPKDHSEHFGRMIEILGRILHKPQQEFPKIEAPVVNVEPAPVVVQPAPIVHPPKPIRKWHFTLKKDNRGQTTEITATALE